MRLSLDDQNAAVCIRTDAETVGPTGVEMEALTGAHARRRCCHTEVLKPTPATISAAAVAGLTVYDMVKGVTKAARLTDIQLEAKSGGRSGTYARQQ